VAVSSISFLILLSLWLVDLVNISPKQKEVHYLRNIRMKYGVAIGYAMS
jgi:hypothetical protein